MFPLQLYLEMNSQESINLQMSREQPFQKIQFSLYLQLSHISLASRQSHPCSCLHCVGVRYRRRRFTNTFQVPVSQTVSWPKLRPGLRAISADFVETDSPQPDQCVDLCQHSLLLTNGCQRTASWCIRLLTQFECWDLRWEGPVALLH